MARSTSETGSGISSNFICMGVEPFLVSSRRRDYSVGLPTCAPPIWRGALRSGEQRIQSFLDSDRAAWYHHVNITAHDHGGHFIPWEVPDEWTDDLRRTLREHRPRWPDRAPRGGND